ncbi:MAG: glycosyltransferase family 2 protein [Solirubrobacteraceae bacterium]
MPATDPGPINPGLTGPGLLFEETPGRLNGGGGVNGSAHGVNGSADESIVGLDAAQSAGDRRPSVSVVIPAFNEEESIDWVLQQLPPWVYEVVLIDGLSTDRTEAIARKLRPDIVVVHQRQRGKGAALRAGFAAARGDIVVMMDADGSTDPRELNKFVAALEAGADFVKGSRTATGGGSADFTLVRRTGNLGFVLLVNLLYRSRFTDLCYGYCAFWRRHLDSLALQADGFEIETELVLNAVRAGLKIREVPSVELLRRGGASNLRAFSDGRRVLNTILRHRVGRDSQTNAASSHIELIPLDPAQDSAAPFYLAVGGRRPIAETTESSRWLSAVRTVASSRHRSTAGAALPWLLSTALFVRSRGTARPSYRATRRSESHTGTRGRVNGNRRTRPTTSASGRTRTAERSQGPRRRDRAPRRW